MVSDMHGEGMASTLLRVLSISALLGAAACAAEGTDDAADLGEDDSELTAKTSLYPNDVSILFSLPKGKDKDLLLGASSAGAKGELLPDATFKKLPPLAMGGGTRDELRVVSARIDPCFAALGPTDPAACKNQIRLVFQPIDASEPNEKITPKDAAVHAFYSIDRAELTQVAKEILAARRGTAGSRRTALGVHPLIEAQGLSGTFATDVRAVLVKHAGKENLSRVTFMTREPSRQGQWKFGGFDIVGARHTKMKIATLGDTTEQTFSTLARNGSATPAPVAPDDISLLFRTFEADAANADALKKAYSATVRITNPTVHSPDTMDCVSCHTAASAKIYAEKSKGQSSNGNPAAFASRYNLSLSKSPATEKPDNLHAFGYFFQEPSISSRTANESAAVAEAINTTVLSQR
jgi:hypothetical protein